MNTTEELALLRRRIGGVEHDLNEIRLRVSALEDWAALSVLPPEPVPTEAPRSPVADTPSPVAFESLPPAPPPASTGAPISDAPPPVLTPVWAEPDAPVPPTPPLFVPVSREPEPSLLEQARPWLERLQLWPPQGGGNKEVQLGAWWATRLGILFAVIGAVFFGVYISLGTPAWIKLIELTALAGGVTGLGAWLERKTPRFGQVVFAGGLALLFFAAMAAYTVPAVKVIPDERPVLAALAQLAVTAGIGFVAWRKNSQPVATMTVILGYVAAWFSLGVGLHLFALTSALALAAAAVGAKRWLKWETPSIAALAGYWAIYGTLLVRLGARGQLPLAEWVWGFVVAGFAVFFWRDDRATRGDGETAAQEAWMQNANSTAALVLGWLTAWFVFPESLAIFYASASVVLGAAAWRRLTSARDDIAGAVLLAKSMGALTLAVIKWTDPEWTGLALMVQAGVMLVTNRRLRSAVIAIGSGIVATVALGYWLQDTLSHPADVLTLATLGRALTIAGFVAWGLELVRDSGLGWKEDSESVALARMIGAVGGGLVLLLAWATTPAAWVPAWCIVGAAGLAVAGWYWKRTEPWLAAGAVVLGAHVALWQRLSTYSNLAGETWANALLVLAPTVAAAWWIGRAPESEERRIGAWSVGALALATLGACVSAVHGAAASLWVALGLAVTLAVAAPWQTARKWLWLALWALGVGVAGHVAALLHHRGTAGGETARWALALVALVGPAALAVWPRGRAQLAAESPRKGVAWFSVALGVLFALVVAWERKDGPAILFTVTGFVALATGLFTWTAQKAHRAAAWLLTVVSGLLIVSNTGAAARPAMWLALAVAWVPALGWPRWAWLRTRWAKEAVDADKTITIQTWLAGLLAVLAISSHSGGDVRVAWYAGAAVAAIVLARVGFMAVVEIATVMVLLGLGHAAQLVLFRSPAISDLGFGFGAVVGVAVVATLLARFLPAGQMWASASMRTARGWLFPAAGLALVFSLMLAQTGLLRPYITVGWGLASLAWFGFGLFARSRPDRLLGLIGLALCVPRMFLVDLHSTLYRIVAFGALGAVLLWVGFSYHRFRHLIADDATPDRDDSTKKL